MQPWISYQHQLAILMLVKLFSQYFSLMRKTREAICILLCSFSGLILENIHRNFQWNETESWQFLILYLKCECETSSQTACQNDTESEIVKLTISCIIRHILMTSNNDDHAVNQYLSRESAVKSHTVICPFPLRSKPISETARIIWWKPNGNRTSFAKEVLIVFICI